MPHRPGSLGRLREIRRARGMAHTDLAAASGVSVTSISRCENGRGAQTQTVFALAKALGVDPGDLYTRPEAQAV